MDYKEGFIKVPGGRVWYGITGQGSPGIPLIVVHGGPGATHDYLETIGELSMRRPVIFYDQLGSGNSDKNYDPSLYKAERFARELGILIEELNAGRVFLLGASWGTMLITEYMSGKPDGVAGIVFSGPAISARLFTRDARRLLRRLPASARKAIYEAEQKQNYGEEYQKAMMQFYDRHLCRLSPYPDCMNKTLEKLSPYVYEYMWGPSEFTCTGTLKDFDRVDTLEEINVPALFTCGRYDEATPDTTRFYCSKLPGSSFIVFEDASHCHHLEKKDEYNTAVETFLRDAEKKSFY